MPEHDLSLLCEAARDSAAIAMRFWRRTLQAWDKGGDLGPVTEADLAVNAHLQELLPAARPEYGWLSEETPDDTTRLAHSRVFIVDPIDGTRAFMAGEDNFAISLAVAEAGQVIAGAVMLPAKDRLYWAAKGQGAFCNGKKITASDTRDLGKVRVLATKANMGAEYWPGGVPELQRSFRTSLAYRLCLVAEGRYDGMLSFRRTWEWDVAAGSLIAAEAGAKVSDQHGRELTFNRPDPRSDGILAANPALHQELRARL